MVNINKKQDNWNHHGFLRGGVQGEGVAGEPWGFLGKIGEP